MGALWFTAGFITATVAWLIGFLVSKAVAMQESSWGMPERETGRRGDGETGNAAGGDDLYTDYQNQL